MVPGSSPAPGQSVLPAHHNCVSTHQVRQRREAQANLLRDVAEDEHEREDEMAHDRHAHGSIFILQKSFVPTRHRTVELAHSNLSR